MPGLLILTLCAVRKCTLKDMLHRELSDHWRIVICATAHPTGSPVEIAVLFFADRVYKPLVRSSANDFRSPLPSSLFPFVYLFFTIFYFFFFAFAALLAAGLTD